MFLVSAVVAVVAVGGIGAGLRSRTTAADRGVVPPTPGGQGSGLDWLLSSDRYAEYAAAHPEASSPPQTVPSPAPESAELRKLQSDVEAALPDGPSFERADSADGGQAGHAVVWLHIGDIPVAVERWRLDAPIAN